ncbi:MAG: PASTA domain-containing protein [Prevotella sp.]|nr:PASTA domain-containing protein [Bacteroidaceae bacterium]MBR1415242.1 PASTA domain-containing protein [Prevotella sp.]
MNEKVKKFFGKFASAHLWLNLLAMLAVLVLLLFGLHWWLLKYTHHGEGIEVPDLYGMDYRKAKEMLEEGGLQIMANDSTYIKEMPAGSIVVQSPAKGMSVKEGRTIYVTINSLTIPRVRIPDLIDNCSYREAQAKLQQLEFRVLSPKLIDGEKDWVYGIQLDGRNVNAGDMVARESALTLVIGNGAWGEDFGGEYFSDSDEEEEYDGSEDTGDEDDIDTFLPVDLSDYDE